MPDPKRQRVRTSQEGADPETRPETNEEMMRRVAGETLREVEDAAQARRESEIIPGNPILDSVARSVGGFRDSVRADAEAQRQRHRDYTNTTAQNYSASRSGSGGTEVKDRRLNRRATEYMTQQWVEGKRDNFESYVKDLSYDPVVALRIRDRAGLDPAIEYLQWELGRPYRVRFHGPEAELLEGQLRAMLKQREARARQQAIEESRQQAAQSRMTE